MSNLKTELESIKYGDLKDKFIELGIGEVFKPGTKKVDLIDNAIKVLEQKSNDSSNTVDAIDVIEATEVKAEENAQQKKERLFNDEVKAVVDKKEFWTKETIEKRAKVLNNMFLQHRFDQKGRDYLKKSKVLLAASKIMFG